MIGSARHRYSPSIGRSRPNIIEERRDAIGVNRKYQIFFYAALVMIRAAEETGENILNCVPVNMNRA
jgi:hypothetical protein